ncbi:PREDICTED: flavonoid 3',5'-hydroxylase-like [Fragaria vesca subsp. vesca]|uniref:flavonoid 3',5'-hydroxylase-like n=1 Tax=Fragaria vesca subsp. vesca TaxID=101020 RepID=UPI0002C360D0|nr:PREDICTED: flavonoid 3',5'-hydroxylase-like [Fragaria vesca subsp. vesca]
MGSSQSSNHDKDENLTAILTLLFMVFTLLWYYWIWKKPSRNPTPPLPPGPRGLPLLGYLPFLGADLHVEFTDMAKVYGPIYKLQLGTKLCIVVSSPELVKQVVRDYDTTFANRDPTIAALIASNGGTDIAFGSYGPYWRKLRKMFASQMLSKTNLDDCYALRKEEMHKSIGQVYHDKIGTPTDLAQFAFSTSINTTMRMLWGATLQGEKGGDFGEEYRKVAAEMIDLLAKPNISDYFPALARFDIQGIERQAKKVQSKIDKILTCAIEEKMKKLASAENNNRKDFLQFLLENTNTPEDGSLSLTVQQLKGTLTDIVVGGTDTTATVVEWVLAELMQHPEEMIKVQEELTQIVGLNNLVEEFHLPDLHHLDAVIKETFRLHPVLPLLVPRCPTQSTTIGGYYIPKGSTVFLNAWAIQRDPSVWEAPLEFRPQRFLNPSNKFDYLGNKFQFLPFGSGRRICPGISLAERMLIYVLASFLHSFDWKLPNDEKLDLSDKFGLVTRKKTPLTAVPTARLSNLELYA